MSEAELYVIRARLQGGIWNKAERGELRYSLPIGFIWGDSDGEVLLDPDEGIANAIRTVFEKFSEFGSIRQVWAWLRRQNAPFPSRPHPGADVRWVPATYHAIREIMCNPLYAGAYHYGKTRREAYIDGEGRVRKKVRVLPRSEWRVLIRGHHHGFVDWETFEMNQARISRNMRPRSDRPGGAIREGPALLQGLAACGTCGRRLAVVYGGGNSRHSYNCSEIVSADDHTKYCTRIGGPQIDRAVTDAFLKAIEPAAVEAAIEAERQLEFDSDAAVEQWRLQVERAEYEADKAARRYNSVEPENRLVARGLESEWEKRLSELSAAQAELEDRKRRRPHELTALERERLRDLSGNLAVVWHAPTTTNRDRKELLQLLLEAGCTRAIITYGNEGSEGMDADGHYKVPCLPGVVVSTVGAGDAYASACVAGLYKGLGLEQAMWIGAANAASVVGTLGAKNGVLTWENAILESGIEV